MFNNSNILHESALNNNNNIDELHLDNEKTVSKTKYNKISFNEYISSKKCEYKDKNFTHIWWGSNNKFTFKIEKDEYENFLKIYSEECKEKFGNIHVLEKPKDIGPLYLDFDLKQINHDRQINSDDIVQIVSIINNILMKNFQIKNKDLIQSYILMKKEPFFNHDKYNYSDGLHIHYPNIILSVENRFLVYDESRKEIIRQNIFSEIYRSLCTVEQYKDKISNDNTSFSDDNSTLNSEEQNINEYIYEKLSEKEKEKINDEIFDKSVIKTNCWFLYGSGKKINKQMNIYEIKYIFDYNIDELEVIPNLHNLIKILSIRNKDKEILLKDNKDSNKKIFNIKEKYLKKISYERVDIMNKYFKKDETVQDNIENNINTKITKLVSNSVNQNNDNIQLAKKLIKLLNPKRATPYSDWIIVGWALYNVSPTLLPEFIQFSKLDSKKFNQKSCEKVWYDCTNYIGDRGYTIASLYRWAKEDNINGYLELIRTQINKLLEEGDIKSDFDVACILKEMYKYDYVCSSINKGIWWEFSNHRWNRIESAYTLSHKMSTEVAKEFAKLASASTLQATTEIGQKSDLLIKKSKDIISLIQNLKKKTFKDKIISESSMLFYEKDFESRLDQNINIIGFTNGVYDLKNEIFRKGCPEDLISKTVGYDYIKYDENDNTIKDIIKFIESIQPDKDMRDYLMCYCASFLEASNKDQKFMIWTGTGMNGKGTLIDLLDNSFGDYFGTLPPTVLTQKRGSSSAATPELADKFGKRLITLQEPEGDDKINVGFMKNITGQDKMEARPLYGEPFSFTPLFKLLLACNKKPNIPSDDGGTWRRIRVIDFFVKFTNNPKNKNERKSDPDLREKLKLWNQGFIWLLINKYYPIYKKNNGLDTIEPERVKISTNKYKQDSNIYIEFCNEILDFDSKQTLPKNMVWSMFKEWFSNSYNSTKAPPQKDLIEYFDNNNFKIEKGINGMIHGIKLKEIIVDSHID